MPFDGCFLRKTLRELQVATDSHVEKIYQPSKDELVLLLRKKGFSARLLIHMKPGSARLHFTESKVENPQTPPMFCMLLRKHLSAAKLTDITQPGTERIAELSFLATNEMGDSVSRHLICEFLGNKTNLILTDENGRILDALRRSDPESADRLLLPGAVYCYPSGQDKLDPFSAGVKTVVHAVFEKQDDPERALLHTVDGFSPLLCREAVFRAEQTGVLSDTSFTGVLQGLFDEVDGKGCPTLLIKQDGTPADFSYTDILQYGNFYQKKQMSSCCELLDAFYAEREKAERIRHAAGDMIRLTTQLLARAEKRLALRLQELAACRDREKLRVCGELLKANLYLIQSGMPSVTVENFYDEMRPVTIKLDPALSPAKNAARYFKEYKKSCTAEQTLAALTEKDKTELVYLESVLDAIHRSETTAELSEIREELALSGYLRQNQQRRKKEPSPVFREYRSMEGYPILVGKNNRQNDMLTTAVAAKNDLWFHVKNIPGSHVIVRCAGQPVSKETLQFAARLAAQNSKAANSANVPVDYTPVKFVKKPAGAKPGMVIYTTNQTLYVTPEKEEPV